MKDVMVLKQMTGREAWRILIQALAPLEELRAWRYAIAGNIQKAVFGQQLPAKAAIPVVDLARAISDCGGDEGRIEALLAKSNSEALKELRVRVEFFGTSLAHSKEVVLWPAEPGDVWRHISTATPPKRPPGVNKP
jgi:hypothetical protein